MSRDLNHISCHRKESRGFESDAGKSFMRLTVLLCDAVVFIPAVLAVLSCTKWKQKSQKQALLLLLVALFSPSIILIDHGHFQYNGVCIGLALMASAAMLAEADVAASALFCLSLNFKQMALYYAPVFFFGLLGNCIRKGTHVEGFIHLCKIGATVVATFAAMWLPFCLSPMLGESCWSSLLQILHRLFPFARGIFEDKVANFWYVASVVYDFRGKIAQDGLVKLSLCLTLFLLAPTALFLLKRKLSYDKIILALVTSSLAFFLCSFQVHEKSLLLSTVPAALYFGRDPQIVSWFQLLGAFTLFPLIAKDEQAVPYLLSQIIFLILMLYYYLDTCRQQVRDGMIVTSGTERNILHHLQ